MKPIKIGERVRYYRNLLGISREELANEQMSTNLIKYIECGNKNLTLRKAVILADTINKIAAGKETELFITAKDLLEPEEECAQRFCWVELEKLENENFNEEKYNDVLHIAQLYNLDEIIIEINIKIALNCYSFRDFSHAIALLEKVLGIYSPLYNYKYIFNTLNTLGSCYIMLNSYTKAYDYYKKSYETLLTNNIDDKILESKILYNLSLCSKKLNKYEDSLTYLDNLLKLVVYDKSAFINGMILKANMCLEQEQYQDALNMYKSISEYGPNYLYIVHHNMAIAFIKLNKTEESIEYLTKSISAQLDFQSPILTMSLINMGIIYKDEKLLRPSIVFFEHTIDSAIKFNQINELIESIDNLKELYEKVGTPQLFNQIIKKLGKYIESRDLFSIQNDEIKKYFKSTSNIV